MLGPADSPGTVAVLEPAPGDLPDPGARPVAGAVLPAFLSLRLALRARPLSAARRLLLALLSGGTGYLLLACLADAADTPWGSGAAAARLAWCLAPLAVVVLTAVTVGRAEVSGRGADALAEAGLGASRLPALAAAQVAQASLLGSAGALVVFVYLREQATAPAPLPYAGLATLLLAVPLAAGSGCLAALRPYRLPRAVRPAAAGAGALAIAAGAVLVRLAGRPAHGGVPLPGGLARPAAAGLTGWALALAGLLLAAPGLLALTGMLLPVLRPGARRLLAGRALRGDAGRLGPAAGLLAAVACAAWTAHALRLHATRPVGPLTLVAAAVVVVGTLACLAGAADDARRARTATTALLASLGADRRVLLTAALLRAGVALAVCGPLTAVVAWLTVPGAVR